MPVNHPGGSSLQLYLLGTPQIRLDGEPLVGLKSLKAQGLLFYLAVSQRSHTRPALAGLLWGEMPERAARRNLRKALSQLRAQLGEYLSIGRETVSLSAEADCRVDVLELDQILKEVAKGEKINFLQTVIDLYRGDFLEGFYVRKAPEFENWCLLERARLREQYLNGLQKLADSSARNGQLEDAIGLLRRYLTMEPWREEAHRQLMLALVQNRQRGAALVQYEICRRILREELDTTPSRETTALFKRIQEQDQELLKRPALSNLEAEMITTDQSETEQLPAAEPGKIDHRHHNLPVQTTPFIGREWELSVLNQLLSDPDVRLVTIMGAGGMGKTRLALEAAAKLVLQTNGSPLGEGAVSSERLDWEGIFFLPLAQMNTPDEIVLAIAEQLEIIIFGDVDLQDQILKYLGKQRGLLIFDNFEHLLTGTSLIASILQRAPNITILVTSRERLNLRMEQVFAIEGLTYPEKDLQALEVGDEHVAGYTAIELFLEAARRSRQDFSLESADDRRALLQIYQLVGGMPLGLELAAAWVDVLSLADIAAEIQQCFDFLETELSDVPARHRSMRATFDSSWRKLDEKEQSAFAKLSIFRGGFTREAAQMVTGASLRQLSRLVNKSFIQFNQQQNRYQIHELLHQYGAEWLTQDRGLERGLHDRHSTYYCQILGRYTDNLKGTGQLQTLAAIGNEIENVRLAWNHAVSRQDLEAISISLESLHRFYWNEGWLMQGIREFEYAVSGLRTDDPLGKRGIVLGRLLAFLGRFYWYSGQVSKAFETLQESLDLLQRLGAREQRLMPLLFLAEMQETLEESASMYEECLVLAREIGDQWAIGHALLLLGMNFVRAGDYQGAEGRWQEALRQFKQNGDPGGISFTLGWLSMLAIDRGEYQGALSLAQESISVAGEDDATAAYWLGQALCAAGRYAQAQEMLQQVLVLSRERDDKPLISQSLFYLGEIAIQMGDYARAEQEFQESLALALDSDPWGFTVRNHDALARVDLSQCETLKAREHLQDALKTAIQLGQPPILLAITTTAAELFAEEGSLADAALLATFVKDHPASQAKVKARADRLLTHLDTRLSDHELSKIHHRSLHSDLESLVSQLATYCG